MTIISSKTTFGFIKNDEGGADLFVHKSAIKSNQEYPSLVPGELVEFDIEKRENGKLRAINVTGIDGAVCVGKTSNEAEEQLKRYKKRRKKESDKKKKGKPGIKGSIYNSLNR